MPSTGAEKTAAIQIQLREPKWVDWLTLLLGLIILINELGVLVREGLVLGRGFIQIAGLFFIAWGYRRLNQGRCQLEMSDRGIFLRCYSLGPFSPAISGYYCAGVIPWENLADVGVAKVQMTKCLGLRLRDPRAFLNSRNQLAVESKYIAANKLSVRTTTRLFHDLSWRLMGYTKLPASNDEFAILEWNRENYGYQIVCVGRPLWFWGRPYKGGPERIAEIIHEQARIHR